MLFKRVKRKNKKIIRDYRVKFDDYTLIEFYKLIMDYVEQLKEQIRNKPSVQILPDLIKSRNIFMQMTIDFGFTKYEEEVKNLRPVLDEVSILCAEWLEEEIVNLLSQEAKQ